MPRISDEKLDEIRHAANIVEIIREYVPLTQKGKNYFGVCPFHQDHSPSMSVSEEKQMYKCFSCGAGGNVFKFISDIENIGYMEAIEMVAQKVGIAVSISSKSKPKDKYDSLYQIMNLTEMFYENNLDTEKGTKAREYLKTRGLDSEMIKTFNIGLSFDDNGMYHFFKQKKIKEEELVNLGLLKQNGLEYKDIFQNRILFPIHSPDGKTVGFTGRIFQGEEGPKYFNSRETVIFKKGNILFNYHRARDAIRLQKKVILVEGNMDAIRMFSSGIQNTIALMGTSLTKEQILLLQKLRVPVILMLDNDSAGALATFTNGSILEEAGLTVEVVRLSGEKDPDEYIISNGVEKMLENIKHAISFLEYKLLYLKENKNLEDPNVLANYIKEVLKTLEGKDSITVEVTLNKLAQEYHLSYDILKKELHEVEEKVPTIVIQEPKKKKSSRYEVSANHILYFMMNDAKYIRMYQEKLGFFKEETYRGIASEILYYYNQKKGIEIADFLTYAESSPLKSQIYDVLQSIKEEDLEETSMEDYISVINELTWKERVKELKQEMRNSTDIHQKEKLGNDIIELTKKIQEIRKERSVRND